MFLLKKPRVFYFKIQKKFFYIFNIQMDWNKFLKNILVLLPIPFL